MRITRIHFLQLALLLCLVLITGFLAYWNAFKPNLKAEKEVHLYVDKAQSEQSLGILLDSVLTDTSSFVFLAKWLQLKHLKPGHYLLKAGTNNYSLINKFRKGVQDPVLLVIHSVRDMPQLSGKLAHSLMTDSLEFLEFFMDSNILQKYHYTNETILSAFIANTYQVYWNISPEKLLQRMIQENQAFWNLDNRLQKATDKGLTPLEIYTIASIVEKETILDAEKSDIAGVYINRLKMGMKLQADPTVVFALGLFGIQRVLLEHLKTDSPYNTYLVEGLPPGPICMPSVTTIDAVVNAPTHEYLFFCAKPGYDGSHAFSKTLAGHYENAKRYRTWLNAERIR